MASCLPFLPADCFLPTVTTSILPTIYFIFPVFMTMRTHRLFAALFASYNQFIRPVENVSDPVIIQFEVSMSQLVKVIWNDYKLKWNPAKYGEIYPDITYSIYIRRLPLFYTINMIIPCLLISFLTVLVFYLPSDCGEKVTLCISVLLSLTVFLLVITETIPSTSLVIPLIGEYLLFTMIFVTLSIVITVFVLNVHYRTPKTHTMPQWVKTIFLNLLPRIMFMTRPASEEESTQKPKPFYHIELSNLNCFSNIEAKCCKEGCICQDMTCSCSCYQRIKYSNFSSNLTQSSSSESLDALLSASTLLSTEMRDAIESVKYIAETMRLQNEAKEIQDDWKYVAMVIDRIFLWVFILVCILGTAGLFLQPLMAGDEI
uniref:Cholinergic receptor nicotinic alpha 3 subunit n=1 Tax=Sphenodon punctatus TaxID=8508 RepID=A0A8D0GM89_SPHPU